jgi:hypothetical protein
MTSDTLFDALEICLQALDQGADVESCLSRYPALADELRPILIAAVQARAASVTEVPAEVARRGRARVLQAAAEMREQQNAAPVLPFWRKKGFFGARFYRLALTTAVVIAFLLTGGTGLVNASSGALPGDRLYPVKRSWEGVQLAFVFDQQTKVELEHKFDHERVQEIEELYSEKRFEQVNFQGVVETQQTNVWRISGLDVAIEEETVYVGDIIIGSRVQVIGETDDGMIKAEQISLIAAPGVTPPVFSTATPVQGGQQGITPEGGEELKESQTPEAGEDASESESKKVEVPSTLEPSEESHSENESSYSSTGTPRSGKDDSSSGNDSGSEDGSGGESEESSTEESGGGDD